MTTPVAPQRVTNRETTESSAVPFGKRVLIATGIVSAVVLGLLFLWYVADLLMLVFAGVLVAIVLHGFASVLARFSGMAPGRSRNCNDVGPEDTHSPAQDAKTAGTMTPYQRLSAVMVLVAAGCAACAAPFQRAAPRPPSAADEPAIPPSARPSGRPTMGVAFGGGSARGIAHVGVIRWLEEHRVPIDVAAGTSMGGLIGGAFASGMDAGELETFIFSLDWDQLFGASSFVYKNIRRKADARAYPSRLEFGLRGGIVPPTALNSGEYVELLLGRIAAPYFDIEDFDDLPHRSEPWRSICCQRDRW